MMQIERKEQKLQRLAENRIEIKKNVLSKNCVLDSLNSTELRVAKSAVKRVIRDIPDQYFVEEDGEKIDRGLVHLCGVLCKGICRDHGIRSVNKSDAFRFYDILKKYYSGLSLDEVRVAFEMALTGDLDSFLPKDKNGNADIKHYQEFSMEFVTRILNAFKKYRGQIWKKVYLVLGNEPEEVTEDQKEATRNEFLGILKVKYNEYLKTGRAEFMFPVYVSDFLVKNGVVDADEITDSDYKSAIERIRINGGEDARNIVDLYSRGVIDRSLKNEAKSIVAKKMIIKGFENLKKGVSKLWEEQ